MNPWRTGLVIGAVVVVAAGCSSADRKVSGTATTATAVASPTTSTSAVAKPVDDAGLPALLASPSEISDVVGVAMTPEAIFRKPEAKLNVDPLRCTEALMPGLDTVSYYGRTGFAGQGLHGDRHARVVQVLASFPSDADAETFRGITVGRWRLCQSQQATITDGKSTATYELGNVDSVDSVVSVSMSGTAADGGSVRCQHSLGTRKNVIVDVRVCASDVSNEGRDLLSKIAAKVS
ncbi:sensor domain-containing protein [Mycobacterium sp. ST-F2]|uniref:sensor domain-containing protein n=1 Tax=Mycobacterium sp. ST-F2 TaxID=1490484 RepID=UPI0009F8F408|nr:sensor domain-containing protein [Mycobacterium sp. ST-F2]